MVTEIIIYKLKENTEDIYWDAFMKKSLPAMKERGINILNFGFSIENPLIFHLIRSFKSLEDRNRTLEEFYSSDEWRMGARTNIIESIESSKTTIFED
ncbi:NIPSNAP family protein [Elizabethkingia anophelis]|uniref:NIPSNAP family protein n=1 Tax=Elizabethkingia anophelis TaxID=1117645 RepID=UPI00038A4E24|nr:NIPSNAP family protein [Elizabethkingia anophelis]EQB92723.1 hypothetical protein C874_18425 [Elizabethkingia anophelis 502]